MIRLPLVSVIIVNLNGKQLLKDCLASLESNAYKNIEVIIVDNGSTDGSVEFIKNFKFKFGNVKIIKNRQNMGFAHANNQAVKEAKGRLILLFNNDTVVTPSFLKSLVKSINQDNSIGVVQPKIIFYDTNRLQSGGAFLTPPGFLYYFGYGQNPKEKKYNQSMPIFSANGACILIRREVIDKITLFDKDFFAYYEETDFCHRGWLAGYQVIYEPKAVIYHKGGQTSQKMAEDFIFFHSFKNRLASSIKNFSAATLARIIPSLIIIYLSLLIIYLIKWQFRLALAVMRAIIWNVTNIRTTLKKRQNIQANIRVLDDKVYLSLVSRPLNLRYYLNMFLKKEVLLENEDYPA